MKADFVKLEEQILKRWKEERAFEKSLEKRRNKKRFVFYEGPPTANGSPGIHHVLSRVFKDVVCRYKTMRGFYVGRKAGWDTHGLPVELQIEKKLGLQSKKDIEKYGIAKFNKECRQSVWEYKQEWDNLTERIGFWLDTDNPYITYTKEYMESLWWVMKQFWQEGLLYKDYKVVPYCPRCGTPESSHELAQGYQTVTENSVFVKFKIHPVIRRGAQSHDWAKSKTYFLAWTTTPWTLPGNVALAVGSSIRYQVVRIKETNEVYIVAETLVPKVLDTGYEILDTLYGKELEGLEYEPLFGSLKKEPQKKHYVALADFVSTEEGTGIVHTAVMYGEDDYQLGKKLGLPRRHTVDEEGKFNELVPQWKGIFVKDADLAIIQDVKERGLLYKEELYEHEYPFCWRCSTPLLYYAKDSWFVNMQKVKNRLIANNQGINWFPAHMKKGRMGEWLQEVKDWAFSRERYWGTPLPVWECDACSHRAVIGSVEELKKQKRPTNVYYILRHGHSDRQKTNTLSSRVSDKVQLTAKGKKEIALVAKKLKAKKIDVILSSDLLRTKQTAEIVGKELGIKPRHEKRLREVDVGKLNGKKVGDIKNVWGREGESETQHFLRRFVDPLPGGESWTNVQRRVVDLLRDLEQRYQGKRILLIGHETPFTLLECSMAGLSREEMVRFRMGKKWIGTGELREVRYANLPFNDEMELDLHRPYIDTIEFACTECKKGGMKRVKDVVDVWFDSGSMPFASSVEGYPADYITEAIDQTRGWFYTLLAVATLLGKKAPYKNVISLGHVLDAKGEKMSKSKGNIVNPWEMIGKYGVDTLRWYFYTLNHPWDSKAFRERDLQQTMRKFMLTLWNSLAFYETYGQKGKGQRAKGKITDQSSNILDRWIVSRLHSTIKEATRRFDDYDITGAARAIESFVMNDLSLWYIRRSRQRFQGPASRRELQKASATLGYVLGEVSKLAAPFTPFLAEHIYGQAGGKGSVHWQDWPKADSKKISKKLEDEMADVLEIVSKGLAERAKAGIKVRQPLAALKIQDTPKGTGQARYKVQKELTELVKDEVNVKEVVFDKNLKAEAELDTEITQALRREGALREMLRHIQDMRKQAGYTPRDRVRLRYTGAESLTEILRENENMIMVQVSLEEMREGDRPKQTFDVEQEFSVDSQPLWLGIRKI